MSEGFADEEDPTADVLDWDRFFEIEIVPFDCYRFIIDGYDETGMVHVNWGWYGFENEPSVEDKVTVTVKK